MKIAPTGAKILEKIEGSRFFVLNDSKKYIDKIGSKRTTAIFLPTEERDISIQLTHILKYKTSKGLKALREKSKEYKIESEKIIIKNRDLSVEDVVKNVKTLFKTLETKIESVKNKLVKNVS